MSLKNSFSVLWMIIILGDIAVATDKAKLKVGVGDRIPAFSGDDDRWSINEKSSFTLSFRFRVKSVVLDLNSSGRVLGIRSEKAAITCEFLDN